MVSLCFFASDIAQEEEQMALMLSIPVIRAKDEKEIEEILKAEDNIDSEEEENTDNENIDSEDINEDEYEENQEDTEDINNKEVENVEETEDIKQDDNNKNSEQ